MAGQIRASYEQMDRLFSYCMFTHIDEPRHGDIPHSQNTPHSRKEFMQTRAASFRTGDQYDTVVSSAGGRVSRRSGRRRG